MTKVTNIGLKRLQIKCGSDPDKLAAFENYVSLLAARDEAIDDGDSAASLAVRYEGIEEAHAVLMRMLIGS
jgi:hypothetical protein